MATSAGFRVVGGTRTRRGFAAALTMAIALVAMVAGPATAGGPQAYELNHRRGREVVLGNLGTYPAVLVIPGSQYGSAPYGTRQITAEDMGVEHFQLSFYDFPGLDDLHMFADRVVPRLSG